MITPTFQTTATERVLPKLALDFTTATLDPRITFTRALNTATRINSSGFVQSINADLPRFDYDPVTLQCKGLLIEEARTNRFTYSNDFTQAVWDKSAVGTGVAPVVTANYAISPDGTQNASRLVMSSGAGTSTSDYSLFSLNEAGTTQTTYSIWIKSATGTSYTVYFRNDGGTNQLITVTGTWQRVVYSTAAVATNNNFGLWLRPNPYGTSSYADLLIYGAQKESGAFGTSYIPTSGATATRNADSAIISGTNLTSWYNASQGSYAVTAYKTGSLATVGGSFIEFSGSTVANRHGFNTSAFTTTATPQIYSIDSGLFQYNQSINGAITAQPATICASYKANQYNGASNKFSATAGATGTVPTIDRCNIGSIVAGLGYFNGHIQKIRYWPQAFGTRETQAFSA